MHFCVSYQNVLNSVCPRHFVAQYAPALYIQQARVRGADKMIHKRLRHTHTRGGLAVVY